MSARVDPDAQAVLAPALAPPGMPGGVEPLAFDPDDRYGGPALPSDHPKWMRDTISLSQRARTLVAKLKPVVIAVVSCWEHRVRSIVVGGRRLSVDASGSYRLDP